MNKYDYREAMKEDIRNYINENSSEVFEDADEIYERFYDDMWIADSITGNASGSYTFNTWKAEENICHNMDLVSEAFADFGLKAESGAFDAEYLDVTIRCYLLSECLYEVAEEIANA